jgi:hypothetical protein
MIESISGDEPAPRRPRKREREISDFGRRASLSGVLLRRATKSDDDEEEEEEENN